MHADKPLGKIIEMYDVPRERAVLPTPGWEGWAGGGKARRFWLHPRLLVGGAILNADDGLHLRRDFGITHVASFESERLDHGKGWPHARLCWTPFVDVGETIHPALLRQALDFAVDTLSLDDSVLYAHCQLGGGRGPSLGYMICTGPLRQPPALVLERIRGVPGCNPHLAYLSSIDAVVLERYGAHAA